MEKETNEPRVQGFVVKERHAKLFGGWGGDVYWVC